MAEPKPIPDPNHDRQVREAAPLPCAYTNEYPGSEAAACHGSPPAGQPSDTTAREPVPDPWRLPLTVPVRERDDAPGGAE